MESGTIWKNIHFHANFMLERNKRVRELGGILSGFAVFVRYL